VNLSSVSIFRFLWLQAERHAAETDRAVGFIAPYMQNQPPAVNPGCTGFPPALRYFSRGGQNGFHHTNRLYAPALNNLPANRVNQRPYIAENSYNRIFRASFIYQDKGGSRAAGVLNGALQVRLGAAAQAFFH
jgi:hypothetical protein